jgi:hypothetical protein
MDPARKRWNRDQKQLRKLLEVDRPEKKTIQLFLTQHAALHSCNMDGENRWSLEDQILDDLVEAQWRVIIKGHDHSIAWIIWHIARIEDVAISILVGGREQLFVTDGWKSRLNITYKHSGNAMAVSEIEDLSEEIDVGALRIYRQAVGRQTREIISSMPVDQLSVKVDADRIHAIAEQSAVLPEASGVLDYWSRRTLAGLLLMPATRHNFIHLNEAERIKHRLIR